MVQSLAKPVEEEQRRTLATRDAVLDVVGGGVLVKASGGKRR
jgi:hypothetical protein